MKTITRKTMLYKTKVEYGDYTMNHVQGCSHGCRYPCYAMLMAKRFGRVSSYEEWCEPALVSNTLELLDEEIPRLKGKIKSVQLSFTTDSFMYGHDEIGRLSLAAIRRLNVDDIPCVVLSKGVLPIELAGLSSKNVYGITLVSLDEGYRESFEPGAAPYAKRIGALRSLHDAGCQTWVSMEPYPTPNIVEQDLLPILEKVAFADRVIFGRTNYNKTVSSHPDVRGWYEERVMEVVGFCASRGIDCYIKKGTWNREESPEVALGLAKEEAATPPDDSPATTPVDTTMLNEAQRRVYGIVSAAAEAPTTFQLVELSGLAEATADRAIAFLRDYGFIECHGSKKRGTWMLPA